MYFWNIHGDIFSVQFTCIMNYKCDVQYILNCYGNTSPKYFNIHLKFDAFEYVSPKSECFKKFSLQIH